MKNNYIKFFAAAVLAAAVSPIAATIYKAEDAGTKKAMREAVVENYWGFMSGEADLTSKLVSFYDSSNRLVRQANYQNGSTLTQYYNYEYDENGKLKLKFSRSYMMQPTGDMGFAASTDSVKYEYDAEGRQISEFGMSNYKYEYDAEGNLVKKEMLMRDFTTNEYMVMQTITYSDFKAKNCPQKYVSVGAQGYASLDYDAELEYDDNNNLLKETIYETDDSGNRNYKKATIYYYDAEGMLISKVRHEMSEIWNYDTWEIIGTEDMPVDSVVYSREGENRIKEQKYTYDYSADEKWSATQNYSITESREYDGSLAATIKVESLEGKANTNKVTLTIPESAATGYVFDLYRDAQKIATFEPGGKLEYEDAELRNGTHEYFVQTVKTGEKNVEYNVSNVVNVENETKLPAPTNVHGVVKGEKENDYGATSTFMTIEWDAPEYTDEMGFTGYNIYERTEYADAQINMTGAVTDTKYDVDMYNFYTERNIYVQAMYKLGTADSEPVLIKMDELPDVSAIHTVSSTAGTVSYANGIIATEQAAKISVVDLNGKKLAEAASATSLSIENVPTGVYIVTVECNGKVSAMKVRK